MSYGKLWWQSPHKKSWAVREHLNWGCFPRAGKPGSRGDSGTGMSPAREQSHITQARRADVVTVMRVNSTDC